MKFYAGIDIHKDSFFGTVLDESGNIVEEGNYPNTKEADLSMNYWVSMSRKVKSRTFTV